MNNQFNRGDACVDFLKLEDGLRISEASGSCYQVQVRRFKVQGVYRVIRRTRRYLFLTTSSR